MMPLLLDTNVLIKFLRGDNKIAKVVSTYEQILVPTVVIGEYKAGVAGETAAGHQQLSALEMFLDSTAVKIVGVTEDVANAYARVFRVLKANGTPIPQNDLWIAACAITKGAVVYSLDTHFSNVPLLERVVG
jgi:predicted nucleic acid-binding protein